MGSLNYQYITLPIQNSSCHQRNTLLFSLLTELLILLIPTFDFLLNQDFFSEKFRWYTTNKISEYVEKIMVYFVHGFKLQFPLYLLFLQ